MSRLTKQTIFLAGLWLITAVWFAARPHVITQLLGMLLTTGMVVFGIAGVISFLGRWKNERWRAAIPLGVCVLGVGLAVPLMRTAQKVAFEVALPRYEALIGEIESGAIPVSAEPRSIEQGKDTFTYSVLAHRTNGVLMIEFAFGSGFPIRHSAFVYSSSGSMEQDTPIALRWPRGRALKPGWFRVSD